ncbi:MAG: 2OG-Fe(II) oxygenase [Bacteroidota bacterium]
MKQTPDKESRKQPLLPLEQTQLRTRDLMRLLDGELLALRISPFITPKTCREWANILENSSALGRYSNADDVPVNRIGMTLFETEHQPDKLEAYLRMAQSCVSLIDQILGQRGNPLSAIQESLDKIWTSGCQVEQLSGRPMNPGIIRTFEAASNGGLPPHTDTLLKDLPDCHSYAGMGAQLAANLYLNVPQNGGELEIWDYEPTEAELPSLYNGTYDFIDRTKLPSQPLVLQPQTGELILFRSSCVHSVRAASGGMRTAASCFVGYYGVDRPLTVWA